MACTTCNNTNVGSFTLPNVSYQSTCSTYTDSLCVKYTGPDLTCIGAVTNTCLQDILQSIDLQLCQTSGNYSQYDFHCLSDDYTITNEAEFVSAITEYTCNLNTTVETFIDSTYVTNQTTINNRLTALELPQLTPPCVGVFSYTSSDSIQNVITSIANRVCQIISQTEAIETLNWNQCFVVPVPPDNLIDAFTIVIDQICTLKSDIESATLTLPTFNNVGSCLASPTTTDSLVDTINKIKTRLCQTGTFAPGGYTSTCISVSGSTTLDQLNQAILTKIDDLSQNILKQFSADFTITNVDDLQPCLGKEIALATPINQDRFVAATVSDLTPGTLQSKLIAGSNITLDFSTPTQVTINSTASASTDEKVKASSTDPTAGFLDVKITGGTDGIVTNSAVSNTTTNQIEINPTIDVAALIEAIIDLANTDETVKASICNLISSCPVACVAPSNASVTYSVT